MQQKANSITWERERKKNALALFHRAARDVPAYKDFLKKHKISPAKINTFADFQLVPPISKKNYLRQYPPDKLVWGGKLGHATVWTSTSGSTGEPFYFPRTETLDKQYSILAETFLNDSSYGTEKPALVIVGFGMGVWIGGILTYKAFEIASQRVKQVVSIITPGINKGEIFHALKSLSPRFGQTILIGYPPFMKDILEEAPAQGIDLKKLHLRLLCAAEAFTESFRDYLAKQAGIKNVYRDTLNIYGTADIGAMASETPTSILLRRLAMKSDHLFETLFAKIAKTPTVAQYNPAFITFEAPDGEILLTGDNVLPLIRYAVGDHGGIFSMDEAEKKLGQHGIDLESAARRAHAPLNEMPFVYVYERSDFSVKLYGAIIYPEHIREGLAHPALQNFVTGKFTMMTKFNKKEDEYLEIAVEMKRGKKASKSFTQKIQRHIVESLLKRNAEYRNNYHSMAHKVTPTIVLWNYEDPVYFRPGIKQKWVLKPI
jgi:phenylacetate-CoA ligase